MRKSAVAALGALLVLTQACSQSESTNVMATNAAEVVTEAETNVAGGSVVNNSASTYCDAIQADAPPADCSRYAREKTNLKDGIAAFNPPRAMTVGKSEDLILSVGPKEKAAEVHEAVGGPVASHTEAAVKVGHYMTATLSGGGFKIDPEGPQQRELALNRMQTWQWKVTPTDPGARKLQLIVSSDASDAQGKVTKFELDNQTFDVNVQVSGKQKVLDTLDSGKSIFDSLKGSLTALAGVLAAIGAVWAAAKTNLFGLFRKSGASAAPTPPAPPVPGAASSTPTPAPTPPSPPSPPDPPS